MIVKCESRYESEVREWGVRWDERVGCQSEVRVESEVRERSGKVRGERGYDSEVKEYGVRMR